VVEFRPILVLAVACGGCGARVRVLPFEEDELIDLHLLAPHLSTGTVMHLEGERHDGWHLTETTALCQFCAPQLADSTTWAGTGLFVPVPSWTPLCDGCGCEAFWLDDILDSHPFIVHTTELTADHVEALNSEGWTTAGRLHCPACAGYEATRLFEALEATCG